MAEDEKNQAEEGASKKKPPIIMLAVVAVLMVAEAGAVFLVASMTKGGSASAATELEGQVAEGDEVHEVELLAEQFQNTQSGRVWEWQTEIYLKVRQKNLDGPRGVTATLERRNAEIKEGIALIFRRAQHKHLQEPGLQTISRQVTAYVNEVFGVDADGLPRVERVVIPVCKGFEV